MTKLTGRQRAQCSQRSQRGGTLLGLVIGVVVGLLLALALAVYVTRVPIPFVDREVSRKPVQDEQEAERNKGWNPNASLGQSSPLPQANTSPTVEGIAAEAEGNSAAASAGTPADGATEPDSDPLGDLVRAQIASASAAATPAATPATAVPIGADGATYFIQAGAYSDPAEAEAQRARLALLGVSSRISTSNSPDGTSVLRVRSGPYPQKFMADAVKEKLDANGLESALVRVQR